MLCINFFPLASTLSSRAVLFPLLQQLQLHVQLNLQLQLQRQLQRQLQLLGPVVKRQYYNCTTVLL